MPNRILYCTNCHVYTLKEKCPKCSSKAISSVPAKFSPEDKFGKYRRKYKNAIQNKSS